MSRTADSALCFWRRLSGRARGGSATGFVGPRWPGSERGGPSSAGGSVLAVDVREVARTFDGEFVRRACRSTLDGNWREGVRWADGVSFAYTRPSPAHYPFQWYWDSCFAAIVWRRFDPPRARRELESLLAARRPDGFIGHTIFWVRR